MKAILFTSGHQASGPGRLLAKGQGNWMSDHKEQRAFFFFFPFFFGALGPTGATQGKAKNDQGAVSS